MPPKIPIPARSINNLQLSELLINEDQVSISKSSLGIAMYKSIPNTVIPKAPIGTIPNSTCLRDSFSHSKEPKPIPSVNIAKSKVTNEGSP